MIYDEIVSIFDELRTQIAARLIGLNVMLY